MGTLVQPQPVRIVQVARSGAGDPVVPVLPDDPLAGSVDQYHAMMEVVGHRDHAVRQRLGERGVIERPGTRGRAAGRQDRPWGRMMSTLPGEL